MSLAQFSNHTSICECYPIKSGKIEITSQNHGFAIDPESIPADVQVTRQLREAARAVDIELLDHVIVGRASADPLGRGYFSFRAVGML